MKGHVIVFLVVMLVAVGFLGKLVNAIDSSLLILLLKAQSDCYVIIRSPSKLKGKTQTQTTEFLTETQPKDPWQIKSLGPRCLDQAV